MRIIVVALGALLVALQYRLWFGDGSVQELWRAHEEVRVTRAELVRLRERNQALRAEVDDLKSGLEAIEERARTDLGMIDADEVFYQFVSVDGASAGAASRGDRRDDDVVDAAETAPTSAPGAAPDAVAPSGTAGRIVRDAN